MSTTVEGTSMVLFERPVGTTADWRGMVLVWGRPVSTANR